MTELQETERLEETDRQAWDGEAIRLNRDWGDRLLHGLLGHNVTLPAKHVHPSVRQSAERVQAAEAERAQLQAEIDGRAPKRAQLMQQLIEEGRTAGPARSQAARLLSEFDSESELITGLVPGADTAIYAAWDTLAEAIRDNWGVWRAYLYRRGAEASQTALEDVQRALASLGEVRLIDDLLAGVGIVGDITPTTPEDIEIRFARGQRQASLSRILSGEDRGSEGVQMGLVELVYAYRAAVTPKPAPAVETEPEPEDPPAVQARKALLAQIRNEPHS